MGRLFLEHMGGAKMFNCLNCNVNFTNRNQLVSTRFTGATGRAYLFRRVVNVTLGSLQERNMLTGRHMIRDVMCKKCQVRLGWMYEYAAEMTQEYKEGCYVLEFALIRELYGFLGDPGISH